MRPDRILVIKLSALGDVVLAFPAFARIRAAHPRARITLLTTPPFEALARASPYFDAVDPGGRPVDVLAWLKLIGRLRAAGFSRVYDLQANDRTNLIFQALRPFPPPWSGTAAGCALPHRNPARMTLHSLERQAEQLREAGVWPDAPTSPGAAPGPDLAWMIGEQIPRPRQTLALLVPGSATRRPRKRWPAPSYGELAARLMARGFEVAVIGAAAERPLAEAIRARAPAARDLTGATDFAAVARLGGAASLAVGNDTGPTHLIAAAGAPSLVLFSADSDPALSAPRGAVTVLRAPDLAQLSVQTVFDAALIAGGRLVI